MSLKVHNKKSSGCFIKNLIFKFGNKLRICPYVMDDMQSHWTHFKI